MKRVKSFDTPHKGLRNILSKFSLSLGYTDHTDAAQLLKLKQLGTELFTLLKDHVHTENEHTLKKLETRVPGSSDHDVKDHLKIETTQHLLEQRLSALKGNESSDELHAFYLNFSNFQSQYLEHIYEEETVTEILLQKHFTDEELIQSRMEIMKHIEFPILLLWMKYTIPALRKEDSLGMLSGLKRNAPKEAFEKVLATVKEEMEPVRFEAFVHALKEV